MIGIGRDPNVLHSNNASLPATNIGVSCVILISIGFTVPLRLVALHCVNLVVHHPKNSRSPGLIFHLTG
ncbi:hypothetical protein DERP_011234 [Dermatophagoides pteronyssinus]|uniref:Uncharacterized protein n=1 Tax=Dermatophagoides pteronyssinus TaxID=6956 RepID=A0ABQ8JD22_DERPT|nr:hypothetical protein DERP_011234 [Dermatophagoides pteronyssinus]